jgi:hypothetical protein
MGAAFEVVTALNSPATTTAGTYVGFTANSGQSFSIRQANGTPAAQLLAPWGQFGAAGKLQIKSPRLHDTTVGDTYHVAIGTGAFSLDPLLGLDDDEPGYSTDILTVAMTTDVSQVSQTYYAMALPVYYGSIPGIDANLMTWAQVQSYNNVAAKTGLHYITWVTPSSAATYGQVGAGVLVNSINDQYKAGHSYAVLGYEVSAVCNAVLLSGTDTGNLLLGGPGTTNVNNTRNWFVDLSLAQNLPLIPIIQANNKGATSVYVQDSATESTAFTVSLHLMDLGILAPVAGV